MTSVEKLRHHAKPHPLRAGAWHFGNLQQAHSPEQALTIIAYCEMLGVPATDSLTAQMMLRMVDRLEHLEERVKRLEKK